MNCRVLEQQEFPKPAVAGILNDSYIEARLHTDGDPTPERARAREVQAEHATSIANPWLVVPFTWVWGFFVVADSAQFSALVTEVAPPHAVGTGLTLQTSAGFLLTMVTLQLVPALVERVGWEWAFPILALGPAAGIVVAEIQKVGTPVVFQTKAFASVIEHALVRSGNVHRSPVGISVGKGIEISNHDNRLPGIER